MNIGSATVESRPSGHYWTLNAEEPSPTWHGPFQTHLAALDDLAAYVAEAAEQIALQMLGEVL